MRKLLTFAVWLFFITSSIVYASNDLIDIKDNAGCLIDDNNVKCWGQDPGSGLVTAVPREIEQDAELYKGYRQACAKDSKGMQCWFESHQKSIYLSQQNVEITEVYGTCGLTSEGVAYCWSMSNDGFNATLTDIPTMFATPDLIIGSAGTGCAYTESQLGCWFNGPDIYDFDASPLTFVPTGLAMGNQWLCAYATGTSNLQC